MMRIRQNRLIATDDKVDSEIRLVEERVKGVRRSVVSGDARVACKNKPPCRVLVILVMRTGRRPILSESAPRKGLLRKAKKPKEANRSVITNGEAPNDPTYRTGVSG